MTDPGRARRIGRDPTPSLNPRAGGRAAPPRRRLRPARGHASGGRAGRRRDTPTSPGAAPTRPGSSGTPPRPTPAAGWPPSTSATRRSASGASTCSPEARGETDGRPSTSAASRSPTTTSTPLVVDWRAPVAEPFYRATAVEPMGVARRRHFQTHGRPAHRPRRRGVRRRRRRGVRASRWWARARCSPRSTSERTGRMRDIVATIQAEQDEAIRRRSRRDPRRRRRSRHRQDRRRAAPRRVPPLHAPQAARVAGRAARRARARSSCATSTRCSRRSARTRCMLATPAALKPRLRVRGRRSRRRRRGQGRRRAWRRSSRPRSATASARCRATSSSSSTATAAPAPARLDAASSSARTRAAGTHNERRPYVAGLVHRPLPARVPARARRARTAPTAPGSMPTRRSTCRRPVGGHVPIRPSPPRSRAGSGAGGVGGGARRPGCAASPRSAPRSSACGRS